MPVAACKLRGDRVHEGGREGGGDAVGRGVMGWRKLIYFRTGCKAIGKRFEMVSSTHTPLSSSPACHTRTQTFITIIIIITTIIAVSTAFSFLMEYERK